MYTSKAEIAEEMYKPRVSENIFYLVAITSPSPKAGVTASKLVPRKEKKGASEVSKLFQIDFGCQHKYFSFFFLYFFCFVFNIGHGAS